MKVKFNLFITIGILLISSCEAKSFSTSQPIDIDAINTAAFQTVSVEKTMTAEHSIIATLTAYPTNTPSPTPIPFPTPFSGEINSLLENKCNKLQQSVLGYGDTDCKLPVFSPSKEYLAYVTLDQQNVQDAYPPGVDSVKILEINSSTLQTVHYAHHLNRITNIEWSSNDHLIIFEWIWEGPLNVIVYDTKSNSVVSGMLLDWQDTITWNSERTVFYASNSGEYGYTTCVKELNGYDIKNDHSFPDFYALFDVEITPENTLGLLYGESDNLRIEPYGWNTDGSSLFITISHLTFNNDGSYYDVGPRQAGELSFSEDGIVYNPLADDPKFDYAFEGEFEPTIVFAPFVPHTCTHQDDLEE